MSSEIVTYTGRVVDPLRLTTDKVNIIDIAHSLSNQCRFTGHVREFYSVGQHSVLCYWFAGELGYPKPVRAQVLLHDGSEAYVADLARPVKHAAGLGEVYRAVETKVQEVVAAKFGLRFPFDEGVHIVDNALLAAEQRDLMPRFRHIEVKCVYPHPIKGWTPDVAKGLFLEAYEDLFGEAAKR